ncbi:hypothetical protein OCZ42_004593 [Salmonella enterica]|nr:hypothetical protein [Salmonella enterica]EJW8486853.1 hypothetical protein [Salmonella enterica]
MTDKVIDRLHQPRRLYKPLFLTDNHLKRDLDREFESISQALIEVTARLKKLEDKQ